MGSVLNVTLEAISRPESGLHPKLGSIPGFWYILKQWIREHAVRGEVMEEKNKLMNKNKHKNLMRKK